MHQSVLLQEVIQGLAIQENGVYVDATYGRGGHSQVILEHLGKSGRLIVVDKDLDAIQNAHDRFDTDERVSIIHGSYKDIAQYAESLGVQGRIEGILLDLGVSSPQLDVAERGFSFLQDGPLDMRMNRTQTMDAARFINQSSERLLADVFYEYGEERYSKRIARAIVHARALAPIETTGRLAEIVKAAHPRWEHHKHPATRVFQAIRIYVNQELEDLNVFLSQVVELLAPRGRLAVISFHSLEDRCVKNFMRDLEKGPETPHWIPVAPFVKRFHRIGKAVKPGAQEIQDNPRARSAVLRIGEKYT